MTKAKTFQRKIFYVPGFDPHPPRRYRELFRTESQKQAAISGYKVEQSWKQKTTHFGWAVRYQHNGASACAEFEVLEWADIVKSNMSVGIFVTYLALIKTAWIYISTGALRDIMALRKGPVIAALYPVGFLLAQAFIAIFIAHLIGYVLSYFATNAYWLGYISIWPILVMFRRFDNKIFAYYLMHDYAHTAAKKGAYDPILSKRLDQFVLELEQAMTQKWDEVLVVGHSSGAHLASTVLARFLRKTEHDQNPMGPSLSFLTLGHVVPMLSFLPNANELRSDLATLAQSKDRLFWVDVSAPGDGCAFALCDPVGVSGIDTGQGPLVISAAFTKTLSPETWARLRWRFFRLHFQYLCAFDFVNDYDYFSITAGAVTLKERFDGRAPSPSAKYKCATRYGGQ